MHEYLHHGTGRVGPPHREPMTGRYGTKLSCELNCRTDCVVYGNSFICEPLAMEEEQKICDAKCGDVCELTRFTHGGIPIPVYVCPTEYAASQDECPCDTFCDAVGEGEFYCLDDYHKHYCDAACDGVCTLADRKYICNSDQETGQNTLQECEQQCGSMKCNENMTCSDEPYAQTEFRNMEQCETAGCTLCVEHATYTACEESCVQEEISCTEEVAVQKSPFCTVNVCNGDGEMTFVDEEDWVEYQECQYSCASVCRRAGYASFWCPDEEHSGPGWVYVAAGLFLVILVMAVATCCTVSREHRRKNARAVAVPGRRVVSRNREFDTPSALEFPDGRRFVITKILAE